MTKTIIAQDQLDLRHQVSASVYLLHNITERKKKSRQKPTDHCDAVANITSYLLKVSSSYGSVFGLSEVYKAIVEGCLTLHTHTEAQKTEIYINTKLQ